MAIGVPTVPLDSSLCSQMVLSGLLLPFAPLDVQATSLLLLGLGGVLSRFVVVLGCWRAADYLSIRRKGSL